MSTKSKQKRKSSKGYTPKVVVLDIPGDCPSPTCSQEKGGMAQIMEGRVRTIACRTCGGGARGTYPGPATERRAHWQAAWEPNT